MKVILKTNQDILDSGLSEQEFRTSNSGAQRLKKQREFRLLMIVIERSLIIGKDGLIYRDGWLLDPTKYKYDPNEFKIRHLKPKY